MKPDEEIFAQVGPQSKFLASSADIAIYGGAAGSGKSRALLMEPLNHYDNKNFQTVIFRRTSTQIRSPGGLWDESKKVYGLVGGEPHESFLSWKFPSGAKVKFAGLEYDNTVLDWQGSQIPLLCYDEITTFTEYQFWFMLSRNRSDSGVPGYIRATCNPDADSWVRQFIDWWIGPDGLPIQKRAGKLRWFVRVEDKMYWADTRAQLYKQFPGTGKYPSVMPKSVTFIPALLSDNKILEQNDPGYRGNLLAMTKVEKERLLNGNWNIRAAAGDVFNREDFEILETIPAGWIDAIRFWDKAATKPSPHNPDPDWTRGLKMLKYPNGLYVVADLSSLRDTPYYVNERIRTVATQDGYACRICEQQDPGQAGKEEAENFVKMLAGFNVKAYPFSKAKLLRAAGVSAQSQARNVKILRGSWNEDFLKEVHSFDGNEDKHDDIVDCLSGAFNELAGVPVLGKDEVARMGRLLGG